MQCAKHKRLERDVSLVLSNSNMSFFIIIFRVIAKELFCVNESTHWAPITVRNESARPNGEEHWAPAAAAYIREIKELRCSLIRPQCWVKPLCWISDHFFDELVHWTSAPYHYVW